MKKRFLVLLVLSLLLICVGTVLLVVLSQREDPSLGEKNFSWQEEDLTSLFLELSDCHVTVMRGEVSQIQCSGFPEDELSFRLSRGKGTLRKTDDFWESFFSVGLFARMEERISPKNGERKVLLTLSEKDAGALIGLTLNNADLTVDGEFLFLMVTADSSRLDVTLSRCHRFSGQLNDCVSNFVLDQNGHDFSRKIDGYACGLSLNGNERVNSETFDAPDSEDLLKLVIQGGSISLQYPE